MDIVHMESCQRLDIFMVVSDFTLQVLRNLTNSEISIPTMLAGLELLKSWNETFVFKMIYQSARMMANIMSKATCSFLSLHLKIGGPLKTLKNFFVMRGKKMVFE